MAQPQHTIKVLICLMDKVALPHQLPNKAKVITKGGSPSITLTIIPRT